LGKVTCEVLWPKAPGSSMLHYSRVFHYSLLFGVESTKQQNGTINIGLAVWLLGISTEYWERTWKKLPLHPPSTVHHR
jgi:hypothetical protein